MNQNQFYPQQQQFATQPFYGQSLPTYAAQPARVPKMTNPLGGEKIKALLDKSKGAPKINITEDDLTEAVCTHRHPIEGRLMVNEIGDGKVRCEICGAEFTPVDNASIDDVKQATENLLNVLHTAKMMWLDVPDTTCSEFFQAIAIITKVPMIYKIATENYQSYTNAGIQNQSGNINGFNLLNQIMGQPTMYAQPQYAAPQYAQPQYAPQQPQYGQVDMYGMPAQQYAAPQQQQFYPNAAAMQMTAANGNPMNNGFGYQLPPVPTQVQDVAPAGAGQVEVTKSLQA